MKKINKTRYAILGMIFEKPRSGYEIKQIMLSSTSNFWQESDASIYPMLKILEKEKCVESKVEYTGKRGRKIFKITSLGKKKFSSWMEYPAETETRRDELLLKLFFGATTTTKNNLIHLKRHLDMCINEKRKFEKIQNVFLPQIKENNPNKIFWEMTLENGIMYFESEIKWTKQCIKKMEG
jgi:PadR family transcriptional regulator, regulatory protein AphA